MSVLLKPDAAFLQNLSVGRTNKLCFTSKTMERLP